MEESDSTQIKTMENIWSKRSNGFMQDLLKATEFELHNALLQSEKAAVLSPKMDLIDENSNNKVSIGDDLSSKEYNNFNQRQINMDNLSNASLFTESSNLCTKSNEALSERLKIDHLDKQMCSEYLADADAHKVVSHNLKKREMDDTVKEKNSDIEDTKRRKIENIENNISVDEHPIETEENCESDNDFDDLILTHSPFFLILDIPGISCDGEDTVDELPRNENKCENSVETNIFDSSFLCNEKEAKEPPDCMGDRKYQILSNNFIRKFPEFSNDILTYSKICKANEANVSVNAESKLFSDIKEFPDSIKDMFKSEDLLNISGLESLVHKFGFKELLLKHYECHICFEEFKYSESLVQHIECHGIDNYQCTDCEYYSFDVLEFYRHRSAHTNTKPFACNLCSYECVLMEELTEHVLLHYDKKHECNMCYFQTGVKEELDEHIKIHDKEINLEEHQLLIDDSLQFQEHILWQFNISPYKGINQFSGILKADLSNNMSNPLDTSNPNGKLSPKKCTFPNKVSSPCTQNCSRILTCDFCDYKCNKRAHLDMHMITHTGDRQYKCNICYYSFRQKQNLDKHMQKHKDLKALNFTESYEADTIEKYSKCKKINYSSDHKSYLNNHLIAHNRFTKNELLINCKKCSVVCNSDIDLVLHSINHSKDGCFKCEECDYKSNKKNDIVLHLGKHINNENLHTVDFDKHKKHQECNSGYNSSNYIYKKTEFDAHILINKMEKSNKCNYCYFSFKKRGDLKRHMMRHTGEKPFKCTFCNYTTSRSHQLRKHRQLKHGKMIYTCYKCEYDCKGIRDLKTHQIKCGQDTQMLLVASQKHHKCNDCNLTFSRSFDLKQHINTHTGEKLFKCTECSYKASKSYDLRMHKALKHNVKMYSCSKCEYDCKTVTDLKSHQLTCFQEKKFKCFYCNYESKKKYNFNRHLIACKKNVKCNLCDRGGTKNYECKSCRCKMHPRKVSNPHVKEYSKAKNPKSLKIRLKQK
ncbi:unnamed protein product [Meganyctiphanes norvegica]|uniref:C2H2-type domain-containing protein n=1 Tax=Meganyctiphanes norvegica TaxID=48144 RepID=A0AAV2S9L3_MEGNR